MAKDPDNTLITFSLHVCPTIAIDALTSSWRGAYISRGVDYYSVDT